MSRRRICLVSDSLPASHGSKLADPPSHTCFAVNRLIHTCWPAPQPDWRPSIEICAMSPARGMTVAVRTRVPASLKMTSNAKMARHEMIHGCAHSTCMLGNKGQTESISTEFSSGKVLHDGTHYVAITIAIQPAMCEKRKRRYACCRTTRKDVKKMTMQATRAARPVTCTGAVVRASRFWSVYPVETKTDVSYELPAGKCL